MPAERPKHTEISAGEGNFSVDSGCSAGKNPAVNVEAEKIIAALGLAPLPGEGGWFRPTWRSAAASAIYYLLTADDFSALHRLQANEVWHFYAGAQVEHVRLAPDAGVGRTTTLGANVLAGEVPQLLVPAGVWQGARLAADNPCDTSASPGWALLGCTSTPAWDEKLFELAERAALLRTFPGAAAHIRAFTR